MEGEGWIKLYRKIRSWQWYQDSHMVHLMLHLTMSAATRRRMWKGTAVERGQLMTSRRRLSIETGMSEQIIRTCLLKLKKSDSILLKSTNLGVLITICNYEDYQVKDSEINQQDNQQTNRQSTHNQPADQPTQKKKEDKNRNKTSLFLNNNKNNNNPCACEEEEERLSPVQIQKAWNFYRDKYRERGMAVRVKPIDRMTEKRRQLFAVAIERFGREEIKKILQNVMTSDYCNGRGQDRKGKVAQVEWVFESEERLTRILEGNYN